VTLNWTASADDKVVGFASYRGYAIPIPGVDHYEVLRGADAETLEMVASLPPGSHSYVDTDVPTGATSLVYRIDALDLDNTTAGAAVSIALGEARVEFTTATGDPVYIVKLDGQTPLKCDFEDFLAFAASFGRSTGQEGFSLQADTNDDGVVNFADFLNFAASFNQIAAAAGGKPVPAGKTVVPPATPGVNENAEMSLSLNSDRILPGQTISVDVLLSNAEALQGYGLVVNYDADKFEFVEVTPAENDLLEAGGETPIFLQQSEAGQVTVANAIVSGDAATGAGAVATLTFRVLREFEDFARIEIANGVLFDPDQLSNQAIVMGALNLQSTPTEFALMQNFPNPFNPETTVKYNLAETADVHLQIYNIVGQVVRTLVADRQAAGRYQVRWDGMDDRGAAVSSGIYFYQITAGKFQDVKRLMLLK
jgi:hypothetical protein